MNKFLSQSAIEARASEIRELLKMTENPDIISFGGGLPSPDSFPVEEMKTVVQSVLMTYGHMTMQYGTTEGLASLRQTVSQIMAERGVAVSADSVLITTGSQQGLDLCGKVFINPGDEVACESPTYLAAISALRPYRPRFVEIEMDGEGMDLAHLENQLKTRNIKLIYTIPDFQNPSGRSMSVARRKQLLDLARRYDVVIIEDSPYAELAYDGDPLPPIKCFDTEGRVVYLSTFSKVVCPGFRVGWVCADSTFLSKFVMLKQGLDLHTNQFSQYVISEYYQTYNMKNQIENIRSLYRRKRDAMVAAIQTHFPDSITYSNPTGGMFLWVELPKHLNAKDLLPKALARKVAFVPGAAFFPTNHQDNTMRLNFSNSSIEDIEKGIRILGELLRDELSN